MLSTMIFLFLFALAVIAMLCYSLVRIERRFAELRAETTALREDMNELAVRLTGSAISSPSKTEGSREQAAGTSRNEGLSINW